MKRIHIISSSNIPLTRQIPSDWSEEYKLTFGECVENCDFLIVLDDVLKQIECNVCIDNVILFTGEPPFVKMYPRSFLRQFGLIFTCQKNLINNNKISNKSFPALPWMTGCHLKINSHEWADGLMMTYNDFLQFENVDRINKICLITSNKCLTKGHRDRVNFALKLKQEMPDLIDIYGNGFQSVEDKFDVQSQYKYSIVIENCSYDDYWTEKLSDTFLAGSYPIYYGAPNIFDYFSRDQLSFIDIKHYNTSVEIIRRIVELDLYTTSTNSLKDAKLLVLNKYNLLNRVLEVVKGCNSSYLDTKSQRVTIINPICLNFIDKIYQKIVRLF